MGFSCNASPYTDWEYQESWPPVRCLPFLFENRIVKDGEVDLGWTRDSVEEFLPDLPHDMLVIDVEDPDLFPGRSSNSTDPSEWQQLVDVMGPIIDAIKSVGPDLKLTLFGSCPSLEVRHINAYQANRTGLCLAHQDDAQEQRYREWLNAVALLKFQAEHLAPLLDWYCPDLYPDFWHSRYAMDKGDPTGWYFWDDHTQVPEDVMVPFAAQTEEWHVQRDVTNIGMSVAKHLLPNKPMIPVLGMQWWHEKTQPWQHEQWEFVEPGWMHKSLYQLFTLADSVAVWAQPAGAGMTPAEYYGSRLWQIVHRFATQSICEWAEN